MHVRPIARKVGINFPVLHSGGSTAFRLENVFLGSLQPTWDAWGSWDLTRLLSSANGASQVHVEHRPVHTWHTYMWSRMPTQPSFWNVAWNHAMRAWLWKISHRLECESPYHINSKIQLSFPITIESKNLSLHTCTQTRPPSKPKPKQLQGIDSMKDGTILKTPGIQAFYSFDLD